ncbi:sugar transferase [Pseudoalteromonas sp. KG3]|uniref:sugar transferase n=1 Tax=Pseudoalteromonas sp. KG3 TaxID=2951137 RepID=UPI00265A3E31|nr:sugar transferase [Pseudoalteromonas sp. KG3]WKD22037.1 sugar transferase [Pseudoalteromonas sp. KG3]
MPSKLIRFIDIVLSIIAIVLLSPILIVIYFLIAINMGIPVFFAQERLGYNGKVFTVLKFRSMDSSKVINEEKLEKVNEHTIKFKNDPRITPLGSFLRKSSLDELPQLFNVLKGDMSLVGPRPWVPEEYENLPKEWFARLNAKPGITGLAQINGRSDLDMAKIVELDIEWVQTQSLKRYFTVLMQTVLSTTKMKNVY